MGTSRLTAYYARALPGRRDGDIAPYRHYASPLPTRLARGGSPPRPTAITPAKFACALHPRITHVLFARALLGRRDSRPSGLPARATGYARR